MLFDYISLHYTCQEYSCLKCSGIYFQSPATTCDNLILVGIHIMEKTKRTPNILQVLLVLCALLIYAYS